MGIKYNPLLYAGFQFASDGGAPYFNTPVALETDLPVPDTNGALRVVLATDHIYEYDATTSKWIDTGLRLAAAIGSSPNAAGASIVAATSGNITQNQLTLQPADATNGGVLSNTTQNIAGAKTFKSDVTVEGTTYTNAVDTRSATTMALGASATTINIGNAGATVNIQGTTLYENVTQLQVKDPLITVNKGGGAASGGGSGMEIEEAAAITGYAKTSVDRASWELLAPASTGKFVLTPNNNNFSNVLASSVLTATRTYTMPDITGTVILDAGTQTLTGNKTLAGTINFSALSASLPLQLDASKNVISSQVSLTTGVTGTLPVGNGGTNSSTALNNNRVMKSSGGAIVEAAAITASRALVSDVNGIPVAATAGTTDTEIGYVNGVTSSIQTQLNNKQPLDATLTALAAYNTNGLLTQTAADTFAGRTLTALDSSVVITNGNGVAGNPTVGLDNTLIQLAAYNTNGILTQTAADTFTGRTLTAADASITVTNGNGVSGNPTISAVNWTSGDIATTSFTGANNQVAAANVTGLAFTNGSIRAFKAQVSVTVIATSSLYETFDLYGIQRGADWIMTASSDGDVSGVIFSITTAGQVQYQSTNNAGFTSLTMKFRATVTPV